MRAFQFQRGQIVQLEIEQPKPQPGEALIRVEYSGICNTDVELLRGYYRFSGIAGHEFVGTVEQVNSVRPEELQWQGSRVVGEINTWCGECDTCRRGDQKHCPNRDVLGIIHRQGAFAEYLTLPVRCLYRVPDGLDPLTAVFTEPLAAALEPTQQLLIREQDRIAVLGDGKLGLLTALGLRYWNAGLTLVGKHREKLDIAEKQGVKVRLLNQFRQLDHRYDYIIDATGNADGLRLALDYVRPKGTVVLKTTTRDEPQINISRIAVDEIRLIGSRCGDFAQALNLLAAGTIDVRPLISEVFEFARFKEAFQTALAANGVKYLFKY